MNLFGLHAEIILATVKEHGALTNEQLFNHIRKDWEYKVALMTIQSTANTLSKKGKLVKMLSADRRCIYALPKNKSK